MKKSEKNLVAVVMGSQSDWETMKDTEKLLNELKIKFPKNDTNNNVNVKKMFINIATQKENLLKQFVASLESITNAAAQSKQNLITNGTLDLIAKESIYNNILPTLSILSKEKKEKLILELNSLDFKL